MSNNDNESYLKLEVLEPSNFSKISWFSENIARWLANVMENSLQYELPWKILNL